MRKRCVWEGETVPRADYGNCPEMDERRAWNVGREAREHKANLEDNPFWRRDLRAAWAAGWHGIALTPRFGAVSSLDVQTAMLVGRL